MHNKLIGLSLFANVGIAETYLEDIGIKIVLANEINSKRADFYRHIYPDTEMITGDITDDIVRKTIVKKAKDYGIDFIIATPPCQGMSLAGKMQPLDPRNQLIYYAIEVIKEVKPKYVLLENVPQQLKTKIQYNGELIKIPDYIYKEMEKWYYFNKNTIVSAQDYGVPQMRKRNIILMSRKDMKYIWETPPKSENIITLRDAIGNLPSVDPLLREGYQETIKMFPNFEINKQKALQVSKWHFPPTHSKKHVEWMMHTPTGKTAFENKFYFPQKPNGERINGHSNTYRRFDWDKPCRTITQNNGVISSLTCVHPGRLINDDGTEQGRIYSDPRCLTIYELMIVTSLPDNWNIPDWADEKLIRNVIGEGIPPLMVKNITLPLVNNI